MVYAKYAVSRCIYMCIQLNRLIRATIIPVALTNHSKQQHGLSTTRHLWEGLLSYAISCNNNDDNNNRKHTSPELIVSTKGGPPRRVCVCVWTHVLNYTSTVINVYYMVQPLHIKWRDTQRNILIYTYIQYTYDNNNNYAVQLLMMDNNQCSIFVSINNAIQGAWNKDFWLVAAVKASQHARRHVLKVHSSSSPSE